MDKMPSPAASLPPTSSHRRTPSSRSAPRGHRPPPTRWFERIYRPPKSPAFTFRPSSTSPSICAVGVNGGLTHDHTEGVGRGRRSGTRCRRRSAEVCGKTMARPRVGELLVHQPSCESPPALLIQHCLMLFSKRLQSIPELAHIHVFAKKKNDAEVARWDDLNRI